MTSELMTSEWMKHAESGRSGGRFQEIYWNLVVLSGSWIVRILLIGEARENRKFSEDFSKLGINSQCSKRLRG